MKRTVLAAAALAMMGFSVGCRQEVPEAFESNLVHSHKYALTKGLPMDQVVQDTDWALQQMFGTPDDPKLPDLGEDGEDVSTLVSLDGLKLAAGPAHSADGAGLYRQHCKMCHGTTGDGRGPTGSVLVPYPRDYRMGIFKFKSTTRGAKPTREDLAQLIRHGIPGTSMNPIPGITEEQIQALVDYVIYLSWRGEVERKVVDAAMFDLDLPGGDRVIRPELVSLQTEEIKELSEADEETLSQLDEKIEAELSKEIAQLIRKETGEASDDAMAALVEEKQSSMSEHELKELQTKIAARIGTAAEKELWERREKIAAKELYQENWGYIVEAANEVAASWLAAEDEVTEVDDPGDIPVPANREEFIAMSEGPQAEALAASVERGRQLFTSEAVGCAKCHGMTGKGDGQTADYDDWTKDWTVNVGLDPKDTVKLTPLLARGALAPQNIRPRNFEEGVFRGGSEPEALFRRIANGIAGTPMPAAPEIEGQFERKDIWHLINYIRSLDKTDPNAFTPAL